MANPLVVGHIIEQHAEEAAFLWSLRDAATDQPNYSLPHLATLEERIDAHIDGLRVAGLTGKQIAWTQLRHFSGSAELFPVATLALENQIESEIQGILEFAEHVVGSRRGLFGALGWASSSHLAGHVASWLKASSAFHRLLGVVACSLNRVDPQDHLGRLLEDQPLVRARALRLAGELGRIDLCDRVDRALDDDDDICRFWAAWSGGLLGDRATAIPILQAHAAGSGQFKWRALDLAIRLLERETAITWLRDLAHDPINARTLVIAVGILADPVVVPWLIERMSIPHLARVAGESFCIITGADLSELDLDGAAPEGFTVGPTDQPDDDDVVVDPDDSLPWPNRGKVQLWWQREGNRFVTGVRYLRGHTVTQETCRQILRDGSQQHRRAAAFELALLNRGSTLWNWRARADAQVSALR